MQHEVTMHDNWTTTNNDGQEGLLVCNDASMIFEQLYNDVCTLVVNIQQELCNDVLTMYNVT